VVPAVAVPVSVLEFAAQSAQTALFPAAAYFATTHAVQVAVTSPLPAVQVTSALADVHVAASGSQPVHVRVSAATKNLASQVEIPQITPVLLGVT